MTGTDAERFNRDDFTMTTVGVSQQFVNPAKRRARAARASADIGIAEADVAVDAQYPARNAPAWIDVYYGERRLEQMKLLDESLAELQETVTALLSSGSAGPSQAVEPERSRAQVHQDAQDLGARWSCSSAWSGITAP